MFVRSNCPIFVLRFYRCRKESEIKLISRGKIIRRHDCLRPGDSVMVIIPAKNMCGNLNSAITGLPLNLMVNNSLLSSKNPPAH